MWLEKAGIKTPAFFGSFRNFPIFNVNRNDPGAQEKMISRHSAGHKFRCFNQGIFSIALFETS